MSKNTMLYGLLIAGGLLVYFAWKKKSESLADNSQSTSSTSATFVDDVPVSQEIANELSQSTGGIQTPVRSIKEAVSQVVEPLIGVKKQAELSGQGQFFES